ncbi:MAG: hypothetical protein KAW46_01560 [candidate division Zixibacteria bacterium]|nr:hypothetical protein [candidate division Zixibacteria bacterium]
MSKNHHHPTIFQSILGELPTGQERYHFLIYIDIDACLACTEDMAAWIELEKNLPQCGCSFSLWAPASDSFDVAYAMELEGLRSPVRVVDRSIVREVERRRLQTPIKVLLDSLARPINIKGAVGNREESRRYAEHILSDVCREN